MRRWLKRLAWTFATLALLAAIAWGVFAWWSTRRFEAEIAKIRQAGQPATWAQWDSSDALAQGEEAGRYYLQAIELVGDDDIPEREDELTPAHADVLALLDKAAAIEPCTADIGVAQGLDLLLPRMSRARKIARLASLRTGQELSRGNADAAARSVVSALCMNHIFRRRPIMISHLVAVSIDYLLLDSLPALLEARPSPAALNELAKAIDEREQPNDLRDVMIGERIFGIGALQTGDKPKAIERWMAAEYLRTMARAVDICGEPWPRRLNAVNQIKSSGFYAAILLPTIQSAVSTEAKIVALRRAARAAVAVEQYRREHGKLPDKLPDPLLPDPFTGEPLLYKIDGEGYTVSSAGPDVSVHVSK